MDIESASDTGGGFNLGWLDDSEWLEYTIAVTPGPYDLSIRVASAEANPGDIRVLLNEVELGVFPVESTGDWYNWQTLTLPDIDLTTGGDQVLRVEAVGNGINFNWIAFDPAAASSGSASGQSAFDAFMTGNGVTGSEGSLMADLDGDGDPNVEEFAFGTSPVSGGELPVLTAHLVTDGGSGYPAVSFPVLLNGAYAADGSYTAFGTTYIPLVSSDLQTWSPGAVPAANPPGLPVPPPGYKYITYRAASPVSRLFFCLKIEADL